VSSLTKEMARRRKYSQKQKDEFFALLDRLGSVTEAAGKLGLNRETCYQWVRKAAVTYGNTSDPAVVRVKYTPEQKKEFFSVLNRVGSVTLAAAELGINVNTCFRWASTAGIASRPLGHGRRDEFVRLLGTGVSRRDAARILGVPRGTAREWDLGIRKSGGRRIYPDRRVVDYNRGVTSSAASASPSGTSPAPPLAVSVLEQVIDPRYLSLHERETIRDLLAVGKSQRKIAEALGRPVSTVSREIARNSSPGRGYYPYAAHRAAASRRPRPKDSKLAGEGGRLRTYVKDKLRIRWSPVQISNTLVKEFPDDPEMRVSHETVYQALYVQARGGLKREVQAALRTGRTRRKARNNGEQRRTRFVDPMVNISERPPEVEDRAVPGHWEGDLITGAYNQSAIATLVERQTRYVMLVHLPGDHTAETVRDGLIATMNTLPEHLRGSLTWDQGSEMAAHRSFSMATDMNVYFCDPASPWQRGSNENANGLLRQYFPKGTDLSIYGTEELEHVAQELNGRPRKTLGWDTPAERLRELLLTN
jgi:IS30 family transposase